MRKSQNWWRRLEIIFVREKIAAMVVAQGEHVDQCEERSRVAWWADGSWKEHQGEGRWENQDCHRVGAGRASVRRSGQQ